MYVTKEQIRRARRVNLADYLLRKYPADVKIVGTSLYLRKNPSLYVKKSIPDTMISPQANTETALIS